MENRPSLINSTNNLGGDGKAQHHQTLYRFYRQTEEYLRIRWQCVEDFFASHQQTWKQEKQKLIIAREQLKAAEVPSTSKRQRSKLKSKQQRVLADISPKTKENVNDGKISNQKIDSEKASNQKVNNEKASNQEVNSEKTSNQKVNSEKTSNQSTNSANSQNETPTMTTQISVVLPTPQPTAKRKGRKRKSLANLSSPATKAGLKSVLPITHTLEIVSPVKMTTTKRRRRQPKKKVSTPTTPIKSTPQDKDSPSKSQTSTPQIHSSACSPAKVVEMATGDEDNVKATTSILEPTLETPITALRTQPDIKIEAWTSKFIKAPLQTTQPAVITNKKSFETTDSLGIDVQKAPDKNPVPTDNLLQAAPMIVATAMSTVTNTPSSTTVVATTKLEPMVGSPAKNLTTNFEFVPPATVTRRAVRHRDLPPDYLESPLTRARRIDTQNSWREQQLRNFFGGSSTSEKRMGLETKTITFDKIASEAPINVFTKDEPLEAKPASKDISFNPPTEVKGEIGLPEELASIKDFTETEFISAESIPFVSDETIFDIELAYPSLPVQRNDSLQKALPVQELESSTQSKIATLQPRPSIHPRDPTLRPVDSIIESSVGAAMESPEKALKPSLSIEEKPSEPAVDLLEVERRRRLKDRNEKALEKKKQLILKAQQLRANLTGKQPVESIPRRKQATISGNSNSQGRTLGGGLLLQKQAMLNNANIKIDAMPTTPQKQQALPSGPGNGDNQMFKLPLPKVKTPISAKKTIDLVVNPPTMAMEHPPSDETFTTGSSTISKDPTPSSPRFAHIMSDSSEDELAPKSAPAKDTRPSWAHTPEVSKSLHQQRTIRPEDIFGEVEPVKLEDFFKTGGRKFTRGRTSSVWNPL